MGCEQKCWVSLRAKAVQMGTNVSQACMSLLISPFSQAPAGLPEFQFK